MTFFIYGQDEYRVNKTLRKAILGNQKNGNVAQPVIISEDSTDPISEFEQALLKRDLFGNSTTVVARGIVFKKGLVSGFEKLLDVNFMAERGTILIVVEAASAKELSVSSRKLFELFNKGSEKVFVCEILTGLELSKWVVAEADARGLSLGSEVAKDLIAAAGNDTQLLANELDKLANYCGQNRVTVKDITALVVGSPEFNVFELVDAIAAKNKNRAYELLYLSLRLNNDPLQLLRPIIYQFRNLLMVKDYTQKNSSPGGLEKIVKLHPFVIKKTLSQVRSFEMDDLKRLYAGLADMDTGIKSGLMDPAMAFDNFILHL